MNSFNKLVLIVSVLLTVEATHKSLTTESDGCSVKFPNGFYCNLICQQWHVLKGNTVMCFISNDGVYHRFVGRNPAYGIWRFYKVDETSDVDSLCKVSLNGDKFVLNKTDTTCSISEPSVTTLLPHSTEHPDNPHDDSTSDSRRLSLKFLIHKINKEVAKLFKGKIKTTEEPNEESENPETSSSYRYALARSSSTKTPRSNDVPPMDDICQLFTTDVCRQQKVINCKTSEQCCWSQTDTEACKPESLTKYNECYKGLGVIMAALLQ